VPTVYAANCFLLSIYLKVLSISLRTLHILLHSSLFRSLQTLNSNGNSSFSFSIPILQRLQAISYLISPIALVLPSSLLQFPSISYSSWPKMLSQMIWSCFYNSMLLYSNHSLERCNHLNTLTEKDKCLMRDTLSFKYSHHCKSICWVWQRFLNFESHQSMQTLMISSWFSHWVSNKMPLALMIASSWIRYCL
jgi:hypothetical protein